MCLSVSQQGCLTTPSSPSVNSRSVTLGPSLSLSNISGMSVKSDVKKRRAPPPPSLPGSGPPVQDKASEKVGEGQLLGQVLFFLNKHIKIFLVVLQLQGVSDLSMMHVLIMYWFRVYSLVVRQSNTLGSVPLDISGSHPASYRVMMILLTLFPVLPFTSLRLCCNHQPALLSRLTFSIQPLTALPSGSHQPALCVYESVSVLFAHLFVCYLFFRSHIYK